MLQSTKSDLEELSSEIEAYETLYNNNSPNFDYDTYTDLVDSYNALYDDYSYAIDSYNSIRDNYVSLIDTYNQKVNEYNSLL